MANNLSGFIDETQILENEFDYSNNLFSGKYLFDLNITKIPCLIDPIIPKKGIWALIGGSDTGKSMLLRQLAIDIAFGNDFLGFKNKAVHKRVLFVSTEDDDMSTSYILRNQLAKGFDPEKLNNLNFYFNCVDIPQFLSTHLADNQYDLILADAWGDLLPGETSMNGLTRQTMNEYKSFALKYDLSIGFLHHAKKGTENSVNKNDASGAQSFEASCRLVMKLMVDPNDFDSRHLFIVKGNYLGKDYKEKSYKLNFHTPFNGFESDRFYFENTGERFAPDEVIQKTEREKKEKQKIMQPHEVDFSTHLEILDKVFKKSKELRRGDLINTMVNAYSEKWGMIFSDSRCAKWLTYYTEEGLILKNGINNSPKSTYSLASDS